MKSLVKLAVLSLVPVAFIGCLSMRKAEEKPPSTIDQMAIPPNEVEETPSLLDKSASRSNKGMVDQVPQAPPPTRMCRLESSDELKMENQVRPMPGTETAPKPTAAFSTEEYGRIQDNPFFAASKTPLSTFSIDVDGASYSNTRRFLTSGALPPPDAVRIEELLNYFNYADPVPVDGQPFAVSAEVATTPWNAKTRLVRIGLQARKVDMSNVPANNLVFLIDVSGSMEDENKLPLLKNAFRLLVDQLRPQDRVSLCVYAGNAGLVLPPTSGSEKQVILDALEHLEAGGSTAGGEGIQLAYATAKQSFLAHGSNRIILATDGDFNVGASSDGELVRMIEKERESGVYLSVLGFGSGNYKDTKMEQLADKGNGNYAYIDNLSEARRVLVEQASGTLVTVAKDVKLQVEFNPQQVESYRLIGYENRLLADQDFNDDTKDAGDMGAGQAVTALYEVAPKGVDMGVPSVDPLRYSKTKQHLGDNTNELLQIKVRYKNPEGGPSRLLNKIVNPSDKSWTEASPAFRFASSVAEFGLLLRDSPYKAQASYENLLSRARHARLASTAAWHDDFIHQAQRAQELSQGGGELSQRNLR